MTTSRPREGDWAPPLTMSGIEVESDHNDEMDGRPPVHPVPTMQGAFEESMMETLNETDDPDPSDRYSMADSVSRRKMLLEQAEYERTVAGRWRQKPGEKFHPLWKLVAQISFGMHLLQQALAKSEEDVIRILQTHVDDVDGFLERTTEDFELAQSDINERIRYLRLPLEHGQVFDAMLNDRSFRISIVEGNEKIEHIIDRTAAAMTDALKDVQKGLDATRELAKYLTRVDKRWDHRTEEHDHVYLAMIGNTEGWTRAFLSLQSKGNTLRKALVQLRGIVAEMQKRAGAASRKNLASDWVAVRSINGRYYVEQPTSSRSSMSPPKSPHKPLPRAPDLAARPSRAQRSPHLSVETSRSSRHTEAKRGEPSSPYLEQAIAAKRVEPVMRVTSSERLDPTKSPKSTSSAKLAEPIPAVPKRSSSHKGSISERTRSITRKFSFFKEINENDRPSRTTPAHDSHAQQNTTDPPLSPALRRLSSRKGDATSSSAYSSSPTSPTKRKASPIVREASPPHVLKIGDPVPTQSSYGSFSLLPMHSAISPLTESSFMFGEKLRPKPHSRSPSEQKAATVMSRRNTERDNSASHPLTTELSQDHEGSSRVSHNPLVKAHDEGESNVKPFQHPGYVKPEIKSDIDKYRPDLNAAVPNEKPDFGKSQKAPTVSDVDAEWDISAAHALLIEAQNNLKNSQRPSSPAISELEAPLPSSHPLRSDYPSKTAPSTPPRYPIKDLPLRHYCSQENLQSLKSLQGRETERMLKRSNSLIQRGSAQFSPDVVNASIAFQALPLKPAVQSSNTYSPLRVVTDMTSIKATSGSSNHDIRPPTDPNPSPKRTSGPTEIINAIPAVPTGPPNSLLIEDTTVSLNNAASPMSTTTISRNTSSIHTNTTASPATVAVNPVNGSSTTTNNSDILINASPNLTDTTPNPTDALTNSTKYSTSLENSSIVPTKVTETPTDTTNTIQVEKVASASPTPNRSPSSQVLDISSSTRHKASADNIPIYLNPASSTALGDFLGSRHPPSSPHPGTQVYPSAEKHGSPPAGFEISGDHANTTSAQPIVPVLQQSTSSTTALPSSHNETPALPPESQTDLPRLTPSSPLVEKRPKWKKVFGSRGAARQKPPKTRPEVVIVGKGEWYKIERKKKGHESSKGSTDLKDAISEPKPVNENPPAGTATVEAGFMGVGKDGVWISRKNFVKT